MAAEWRRPAQCRAAASSPARYLDVSTRVSQRQRHRFMFRKTVNTVVVIIIIIVIVIDDNNAAATITTTIVSLLSLLF